jgi:ArsR family transcriptional regulator
VWHHEGVPPTRARPSLPLADLAACCNPAPGRVLDQADAERLAGVLKALAEPNRLRLVSMIAANAPAGATCVCDLIEPVGLSQPTVSHHLKVLTDAGLLEREQRGKWAYYTLVPDALAAAAAAITPVPTG